MQPQRHYNRAPIAEAILEVRVKLPEGTSLIQLERCGTEENDRYPNKRRLTLAIGSMEVGERVSSSASSESLGFLFASTDGKQIFQARRDGFAMSRLAPYDRWETFRDEARRLWNVYRGVAQPTRIERLALRYVNRFNFPLPLQDLKEYLLTVPEIAPGLPQGLAGYYMQLRIPQEDLRGGMLLNEAIIEPAAPNTVSILLDIDLFRESEAPQVEEEVWAFYERLHTRKNEVFEACITDRTRELIA